MNEFFTTGASLGEILLGAAPGMVKSAAYEVEAVGESPAANRAVCKIAADMYEACGKEWQAGHHLYRKLASAQDVPEETFDMFVGPVLEVLGGGHVKEAVTLKQLMATIAGGAVGLVPSGVASAAALSAATGAGIGATAWYLNRDASSDSMEMENIKRRIDQYDKATAQLNRRLSRQGLLPARAEEEGREVGY
jgi:hypothetical protein